jgi:hypothetical protein
VGALFFVDADEIFLTSAGDVKGPTAVVDTNDAAHTYRIVVGGTAAGSPVTVFYDGVSTLTGVTYSEPTSLGPVERVFWGEGSTFAFGTLEWEYFRHNAAICTTTTTTTATSSSSTSTSTTSTSTSTSSSTSTLAPTTSTSTSSSTSTTLPAGGCDGIPDGPTFASIICRLDVLVGQVNAESGLGSFQAKLAKSLVKASGRTTDAQTVCADGNVKKTKRRLKQAAKAVSKYGQRLGKRAAQKQLEEGLRLDFLGRGELIAPDVEALRAQVECPASAL